MQRECRLSKSRHPDHLVITTIIINLLLDYALDVKRGIIGPINVNFNIIKMEPC
jgi:hypothetical protein